jgi:oligoribonuclease NrnB/cAMP/cGMP phosphodiesterase (DHH superfamily)
MGGEIWFKYFVKGAQSWQSMGGIKGLADGNWSVTSSLIGYKMQEGKMMPVFMASALSEYTNAVRTWTFELNQVDDGSGNMNYAFKKITESQTLQNGKFSTPEIQSNLHSRCHLRIRNSRIKRRSRNIDLQ